MPRGMEGMDPKIQERQKEAIQERTTKNRIEKQQQLGGQQEAGQKKNSGGDFNLFDSLVGTENPEVWSHQHAKDIMKIGYDPANAKSFWQESNWNKVNKTEEGVLKSLIRRFKEQVMGPGVEATNRENQEFAAKRAQEGFSVISDALFSPPKPQEAANNDDAFKQAA